MEHSTEEQLSLFAEDSPASPTLRPGSDEARKMTVHSGQRCYELYGRFSQVSLLVKTLLESSTWNSTRCYLTWKQLATPAGRLLFRLVPSMPGTDETESGFLATATATANQLAPSMQKHKGCRNLLPTPTQRATAGKGEQLFETSTGSIRRRNEDGTTSNMGLLPTLAARDWKDSDSDSERNRNTPPLATHVGGQLSPEWLEWFMGYPEGWGELSPSETQLCHK